MTPVLCAKKWFIVLLWSEEEEENHRKEDMHSNPLFAARGAHGEDAATLLRGC
jgi:hypothetical protein